MRDAAILFDRIERRIRMASHKRRTVRLNRLEYDTLGYCGETIYGTARTEHRCDHILQRIELARANLAERIAFKLSGTS